MADWIIALATVAGVVAGASGVYAHVLVKIARLQGHVDALDMEIGRLVRQQQRLENLILALLGQNPRHLQDFKADT